MTLLMRISLVLMLSTTTLGVFASQADEDKATIEEIIIAIENGWESGQGRPFYEHYLDHKGARYIESGGQNTGLSDLVENHVEPNASPSIYWIWILQLMTIWHGRLRP